MALIDIQVPLKSATSKKRSFLTLPRTTDAVMQEISDLEALPYRDRSRSYGRLCAPITQTLRGHPHSDVESSHTSDQAPLQDSDDMVEHGPIVEYIATARHGLQPIVPNVIAPFTGEPPEWAKFWNIQPTATFSVSLGSVVHPRNSTPGLDMTPAATPSRHTRFLRRVPGVSSLLPHLFWDRKDVTNILSFQLSHNPWRSSGPALPDIQLNFEIKSEIKRFGVLSKIVKFKGLHLSSRDVRTFVMLPSQAVDLCIKKEEKYHASNEYLEAQPEVKTFIERTKANIEADNGTLRTPPSVRIHVPSSFAGHGKKAAPTRPRKKEPETDHDAGILAEYFFAGVEHMQIAGYTFGSYPVRYTSVEGGRLGGKYGDLEILMPKFEKQPNGDDEAKQRVAFIQTVFKLVSLVDTAAQGRLERPGRRVSEDGSEDEEVDIDHEGFEQWTPEHLVPKSSQPTTRHEEDEVDGEEERANELPESGGDHATIVTGHEGIDLARVNTSDTAAKAPPVAHLDGLVQPIEVVPDECSLDGDQPNITKPFDAEESEILESEQRAAASG